MNRSIRSLFIAAHWRTFVAGLALLSVASVACASGDAANQTKSLSLRECVERALENNLEIKSERINPSIGSWGVINAQGVYDPLLSGGINYRDSDAPTDPNQSK